MLVCVCVPFLHVSVFFRLVWYVSALDTQLPLICNEMWILDTMALKCVWYFYKCMNVTAKYQTKSHLFKRNSIQFLPLIEFNFSLSVNMKFDLLSLNNFFVLWTVIFCDLLSEGRQIHLHLVWLTASSDESEKMPRLH